MAKYEVVKIDEDLKVIEVRELNYQDSERLSVVSNVGSDNVTFYDSKGIIWDFEDLPFSLRDLNVGDQIELVAKIAETKR